MTNPNDPNQPQQPPQYPPPPQQYPPPQMPPPQMPPPQYPPQHMPPPGQQPYQAAPPPAPQYGYGQTAPMMVPPGMFFDQASGIMLPNGTQLASVGRRIGAWFLSLLLAIVTLGIGYLIWGLVIWGKGKSPALSVLGMRVWKPEQRELATFGTMALREIVGRLIVEGFVPFAGIVSFIVFLATKPHRALHDMIASTVVIYDPNKVLG